MERKLKEEKMTVGKIEMGMTMNQQVALGLQEIETLVALSGRSKTKRDSAVRQELITEDLKNALLNNLEEKYSLYKPC